MTEYTRELHDRLRELDKAASPAPWYIEPYENMLVTGDDETGEEIGATYYGRGRSKKQRANREMLTDARNAVPALLAEIERLNDELRDTHQRYHDRFSRIAEGWRKRRMARIRAEKEEAWDVCADKAYELYLTEEQRDELHAANPYREESA